MTVCMDRHLISEVFLKRKDFIQAETEIECNGKHSTQVVERSGLRLW